MTSCRGKSRIEKCSRACIRVRVTPNLMTRPKNGVRVWPCQSPNAGTLRQGHGIERLLERLQVIHAVLDVGQRHLLGHGRYLVAYVTHDDITALSVPVCT